MGVKKQLSSRTLFIAYGLTVCTLVIVALGYLFLPRQVPLWYSLAIPEQQLVPKIYLFLIPGCMALICLMHTAILQKIDHSEKVLKSTFSLSTAFILFLFMISAVHCILVLL